MKVKLFLSFWSAAIALAMLATGSAFAQQTGGGHEGNGGVAAATSPTRTVLGTRDQTSRADHQGETGRSEDWRTSWSGGHWWYWGPDNHWSYWSDGRWISYDEATAGAGVQSVETSPQGYGGDGCGCGCAAPAAAPCETGCESGSGCASSCNECGCGCHRHHHHRHRHCCC